MHSPVDIGPWDVVVKGLFDDASVVSSRLILPVPSRERSVYELHSLRLTMSEAGTGNLASGGFTDGPVPVGVTNNDIGLMSLHTGSQGVAVETPSILWHWGRSAQKSSGQGDGTLYLPPGFYYDGALHGAFQNGSGSGNEWLWTVVFRVVRFSHPAWLALRGKLPPATVAKDRVIST